jgi:hypothetical protein
MPVAFFSSLKPMLTVGESQGGGGSMRQVVYLRREKSCILGRLGWAWKINCNSNEGEKLIATPRKARENAESCGGNYGLAKIINHSPLPKIPPRIKSFLLIRFF